MQKNKAGLEKYVTNINNPDLSLGIYLTTTKVAHYRLLADNRREKEEAKK